MAEIKTPHGLVVGLIIENPTIPQKKEDEPVGSAEKPKRGRKPIEA